MEVIMSGSGGKSSKVGPKKMKGVNSHIVRKKAEEVNKVIREKEEQGRIEEEYQAVDTLGELQKKILSGRDDDIEEMIKVQENREKGLPDTFHHPVIPDTSKCNTYDDLPPEVKAKFIPSQLNSNTFPQRNPTVSTDVSGEWEAENEEDIQRELREIRKIRGVGKQRRPAQVIMDRAEIAKFMRRGWSRNQIAERMGVSVAQVSFDWRVIIKEVQASRDVNSLEKIAEMLEQYAEVKREAWEAWERSKLDAIRCSREEEQELKREQVDEDGDNYSDDPDRLPDHDNRGDRSTSDEASMTAAQRRARMARRGRSPSTSSDSCPPPRSSVRGMMQIRKRIIKRSRDGRNPANDYLKTILACLEAERELQALNPGKQIDVKGVINWDILANGIPDEMTDAVEDKIVKAMGYTANPPDNTPESQRIMVDSYTMENRDKVTTQPSSRQEKNNISQNRSTKGSVQDGTYDDEGDEPNPYPRADQDYPGGE